MLDGVFKCCNHLFDVCRQLATTLDPLTYGVAALRHVLSPAPPSGEPSLSMCLLVVALFGIVTMCLSIVLVRRDAR